MEKKKKAVLVIGSFNPVTHAHLTLGLMSATKMPDADIWYVPANSKFVSCKLQSDTIFSDGERLTMLMQTVNRYGFHVCIGELKGTLDGMTYNTVEYFKNSLKYEEVYICIGYDKLDELHSWFKAQELVTENYFLVFPRGDKSLYDCTDAFILKHIHQFIPMQETGYATTSSTIIRQAYRDNELDNVKPFLPYEVYTYITFKKEISLWHSMQ